MTTIRYIEIENFKTFNDKLHIDLKHPAVLIGPNNAGKTSIIQALSLWNRGILSWYEKKGESNKKEAQERISAPINRLNILDIPVTQTRFFWNGTKVRRGDKPIEVTINVGIEINGTVRDCRMIFTYRDTEVIYCKPCKETIKHEELIKRAVDLKFHLLYPMSGIMSGISADSEETPLPDGRINVFLGQGQTAQVLRNICYRVSEQDKENHTEDWRKIVNLINRMFLVRLEKPVFNEARGSLGLQYRQDGVDSPLDISLAGRGLQQVLLILAYLYWHKNSVLLVDEPDAHLELLLQRQIYEILNHVSNENGCQVIIATHSEIILDDAIDTNLSLILNGQVTDMAEQKDIKNALRTYGIEHYYKARVHQRILYIEGTSDLEMLRELAKKLDHKSAIELLSEKINCYYTQNILSEDNLDSKLERAAGSSTHFRKHFDVLKKHVPELKGMAIFDSDNKECTDEFSDDLAICYWQRYELENYFITPKTILDFARSRLPECLPLFENPIMETMKDCLDESLLELVLRLASIFAPMRRWQRNLKCSCTKEYTPL